MTDRGKTGIVIRRWLPVVLVIAAVTALVVLWGRQVWDLFRQRDAVVAFVDRGGALGPVLIIVLQFAQTVVAPIPGHVVGVVGGYLYGMLLGTIYSMVGTVLGALVSLILVRKFGRPLAERFVSPHLLSRVDRYSDRQGALFLFAAFLFPPIPTDMACLAAGLTKMPIAWIMAIVLVGRVPGVAMSVAAGAYALELSPTHWIVLIAVLVVAIALFYKYGKKLEALSLDLIGRLLD